MPKQDIVNAKGLTVNIFEVLLNNILKSFCKVKIWFRCFHFRNLVMIFKNVSSYLFPLKNKKTREAPAFQYPKQHTLLASVAICFGDVDDLHSWLADSLWRIPAPAWACSAQSDRMFAILPVALKEARSAELGCHWSRTGTRQRLNGSCRCGDVHLKWKTHTHAHTPT